jgi:hypothetical protein
MASAFRPRAHIFGMKWFRSHIKQGARLALFALAIQFALSFGHFHAIAADTAPAIQSSATQADPCCVNGLAAPEVNASAQQPSPANHDNDRHSDDACAICAVMALTHAVLFATPPVLLLPQAVEFLYLATDADFIHLNAARVAFQPRAPPVS